MVDKINPAQLPVRSHSANLDLGKGGSSSAKTEGQVNALASFDQLLQTQMGSVRLSVHAQRRLAMRQIELGDEAVSRLEQAVDKAASKGSRESLILMDDLALVVNVKNRVVVTAVDAESRKEQIFTNIDSVVLT